MNNKSVSLQWWVVWLDKTGKFGCGHSCNEQSAIRDTIQMTSKFIELRDMTKAKIVITPGAFMPHFEAPTYFIPKPENYYGPKMSSIVQAWALEAPSRYKAITIARRAMEGSLID